METARAGAPELEIQVTSEMIEAGLTVVWRAPIMDPDEESMKAMVRKVFIEMTRAKSKYQSVA
jgi:hypothetical protein